MSARARATRKPKRAIALALAVVVVAAAPSAARARGPALAWVKTAEIRLAHLQVWTAAPMTGYSRAMFGPAWEDVNHNGCDTRNDILRRDLTDIRFKPGSSCVIASGTLKDPYTGEIIHFVRGVSTSLAVQIDHVVALGDAWQTGAATWAPKERLLYANNPLELLAVDGPQNEAKGDDDASGWLPPRRAYDCSYVARQIAIKAAYKLWVTPSEHAAMAAVLETCTAGPVVAPARQLTVRLVSVTSPVLPGQMATVTVRVASSSTCSITVEYKSGPSHAHGLSPEKSVAGRVDWTWLVGRNTTPGRWPIIVTCGRAGVLKTAFVVR